MKRFVLNFFEDDTLHSEQKEPYSNAVLETIPEAKLAALHFFDKLQEAVFLVDYLLIFSHNDLIKLFIKIE